MSNAANIALTAINAFDKNLSIIANNIANANTEGFKKSRAVIEERDTSGVSITPEQVNTPGDMVTISGVARETSNVSLAEELTALISTQSDYEANLKTVKANDAMQQSLFDIVA